jgi:hypothetical protein
MSPDPSGGRAAASSSYASRGDIEPHGLKRTLTLALSFLALVVVIVLTRLPTLAEARTGRVPNMDELYMVDAGLSRALGVPGALIQWPGGPVKSFIVAWLPADFLVAQRFHVSRDLPVLYTQHVARQIEDPWRAVVASRWFVAIVSAIGFASLYGPLARRSGSGLLAAAAVLLLATCPLVWMRSSMALGDAVSWAFVAIGCAAAMSSRLSPSWSAATVGLTLGAALASKVTALIATPLPFFLLLQFQRGRARNVLLCIAAVPFGYALACPEGLAMPGAVLRGIVGNMASRPGGTPGLLNSLEALARGVPIWLLLLSVVALVGVLRARLWGVLLGALACLVLSVGSTIKASLIEAHYLTPMCIVCIVVVALGFSRDGLGAWLAGRVSERRLIASIVGVVAMIGLLAWHALSYRATYRDGIERYLPAQVVAKELRDKALSNGGAMPAIAVDVVVTNYLRDLQDYATREAAVEAARDGLADLGPLRTFVQRAGLDGRVVDSTYSWFNQFDQSMLAISQALFTWTPKEKGGYRIYVVVSDAGQAARSKALTPAQAGEMLERGQLAFVAIGQPLPGRVADRVLVRNRSIDGASDEARTINPEDGESRLWIYTRRGVAPATTAPATQP